MSRANVERYSGEHKPQHCTIKVRAVPNEIQLPDLHLAVNLIGTNEQNSITPFEFQQSAQNPFLCVCQVFYYKENINCWKAILAFFKEDQLEVK